MPFKNATCTKAVVPTLSSHTANRVCCLLKRICLVLVSWEHNYFIALQGVIESVRYSINELRNSSSWNYQSLFSMKFKILYIDA